MVKLLLLFTENQHLVEFLLIVKVSFQRTKTENFYTHYFIWVLAYVVISRHFILKPITWRISSWKIILLNFTDSCIKSFLNKLYTPKVIVQNAPKINVFVKLLFWGSTSFQIRKKLHKFFNDKLTSYRLKIVFMSSVRVKSFFTFKDKLLKMLLSGLVSKYSDCNATYYGKTKRHFKVQICEHLSISHLTGKKKKIDNKKLTAIHEHLLCCKYSPSYEDFSILTREINDFKLKIMESLLISRDNSFFNKGYSSLPLELFWYNISGYHMFYHIIWCPSITLSLYNSRLFSFQYLLRFLYFIKSRMYEHLISFWAWQWKQRLSKASHQ